MLPGRFSVGRASYIRTKLWKETHISWIEMKRSIRLKSDDALACHLLSTTTTVLNVRDSMEANDLIWSRNTVSESVNVSETTVQ